MGWDVVAAGTSHNLPIDDPVKVAERISPLIDEPISVGYYEKWKFDESHNRIVEGDWQWIELTKVNSDKTGQPVFFEICDYSIRRVFTEVETKMDLVSFENEYVRDVFQRFPTEEPFELYQCFCERPYSVDMWIFKENVEFTANFYGRWRQFENIFETAPDSLEAQNLHEFRKHIFEQFKICGCDMAYYFADQGPGEKLANRLNFSSKKWLAYLESGVFAEDGDDARIMKVSDYMAGKVILKSDDWVDCFIDDFSDFKQNIW